MEHVSIIVQKYPKLAGKEFDTDTDVVRRLDRAKALTEVIVSYDRKKTGKASRDRRPGQSFSFSLKYTVILLIVGFQIPPINSLELPGSLCHNITWRQYLHLFAVHGVGKESQLALHLSSKAGEYKRKEGANQLVV